MDGCMFGFGLPGNAVDVRDAIRRVERGEAVLLDVRTAAEYDGGHAVGAINFDLGRIMAGHMPPVGKDDAVMVYCRSGARSGQAAALLGRAGFVDVGNLGGLGAWIAAGGAIEESGGASEPARCEVAL